MEFRSRLEGFRSRLAVGVRHAAIQASFRRNPPTRRQIGVSTPRQRQHIQKPLVIKGTTLCLAEVTMSVLRSHQYK